MRIYNCIWLALVIFCSLIIGCSEGGDSSSPEGALSLFGKGIDKNDEALAKQACTEEFWQARRDAGKRLFSQAVRKKFKLKKSEVKANVDRAVVIAEVIRDGKKVDLLYFYLKKIQGKWIFDGVNEDPNHGKYYLKGLLPARFNLEDYPASSELKVFGEKMINLAPQLKKAKEDEAKLKSLLEGVVEIKYSPASQLRLLLDSAHLELKLVSNHWIESLQRGAIEIGDESGKEKIFIYVVKENKKWRMLACYTGWLASDTVLRD